MMTTHSRIAAVLCAGLIGAASPVLIASPARAMPVFDATNYSQNLLQAARALDQINNQVKSLQNETAMLGAMVRNLKSVPFPELSKISANLKRVDALMGRAKGIQFDASNLDQQFKALFPGDRANALRSDARLAAARQRMSNALDGFRHSMTVQSEILGGIRGDAALLRDLSRRSEGAEGALQAQQSTNQLLALSTKQQFQIEDLLAAEFRSQAMDRARRAQDEADAVAATRRFLGSGNAYRPLGN